MHRSLYIVDIIKLICDVLDKPTLAALTSTCGQFNGPAVAALWDNMDTFEPFIKCFPSDVWAVDRKGNLKFTRPPAQEDWARFHYYATLVHKFNFGHHSGQYDLRVFNVLCTLRPSLVLFPNVTHFTWSAIRDEMSTLVVSVLSMLGDKLTALSIHGIDRNDIVPACLSVAEHRFSRLKHLSLVGPTDGFVPNYSPQTKPALQRLARDIPLLESFECNGVPLTQDTIIHLLKMKHLQRLSFRLPKLDVWTDSRCIPSTSALTHLKISCDVSAYVGFSRAFPLPHVTTLELDLNETVSGLPSVHELFTCIRQQFSPRNFRRLSVCSWIEEAHEQEAVFVPQDIRPLLQFSGMECLSLSLGCLHRLDDSIFLDIAKALPELRVLRIAPSISSRLPSVTALSYLAAYAHNLHDLDIFFRAQVSEDPAQDYGPLANKLSRSSLRCLRVSTSPIESPKPVALFLARIFPRLERLEPEMDVEDHESQYEIRDNWVEVESYLQMLLTLRKPLDVRIEQLESQLSSS